MPMLSYWVLTLRILSRGFLRTTNDSMQKSMQWIKLFRSSYNKMKEAGLCKALLESEHRRLHVCLLLPARSKGLRIPAAMLLISDLLLTTSFQDIVARLIRGKRTKPSTTEGKVRFLGEVTK